MSEMRYAHDFARIPTKLSDIPKLGKLRAKQVFRGDVHRLEWRRKDFRMKCCDCGLVHRFRFNVRGEWIIMRAVREVSPPKSTRRETPEVKS